MSDRGITGFRFAGNLAGRTSGITRAFTIGNSKTITIGDMVILSSGYIQLADANTPIMGVVVGIVDKNGINMDNSNVPKEGTWTSSTHTVITDSDNTTSEGVKALVDIDPFSLWSGETDNSNTDGQSRLAGCYTDITAASDQADDDTAATGQGQLFIWGADPDPSATYRNIYSIAQHQLWGWTKV